MHTNVPGMVRALLLLSFFSIPMITLSAGASPTATTTFNIIPLSAPVITNSMVGYHNEGQIPVPGSAGYARITWRQLEPEKDVYDFSAIEQLLEANRRLGRRAGFRLRALTTRGVSVPDYLIAMLPRGWWFDVDGDGHTETYVPDWNDPAFLDRARKLLLAVGKRYNNDPRLAWLDIGMYGVWGEWHISGFGENVRVGARRATTETKHAIVDMHIEAFPDTHLTMMTDDPHALEYALSRSPHVGWRRDSFGDPHFDDLKIETLQIAKERWRFAPVVAEFFNPVPPRSGAAARALEAVNRYHILTMNTINLSAWIRYPADEQEALIKAGKRAGYRFALHRVTFPLRVTAGLHLEIASDWSNSGVTPCYDANNVLFQLRSKETGNVMWQGASSLSLEALLPAEQPLSFIDDFVIPNSLRPGEYELALVISNADPRSYLPPLALAIEGRRVDGSYALGTVVVDPVNRPQFTSSSSDQPPVVSMEVPTAAEVWQPIVLLGATSHAPHGYIVEYTWSITPPSGNTRTLYGASRQVIFTEPGTHRITFSVKDSHGRTSAKSTDMLALPASRPLPEPTPDPPPLQVLRRPPVDSTNFKPVGSTEIVEDFRSGAKRWSVSLGKGSITIEDGEDGPDAASKSAVMWFRNLGTWGYTVLRVDGANWARDGRNAIRFWVKGSPSNGTVFHNKFKLQLREFDGDGERWSYDIGDVISNIGWQQVAIPFDSEFWYSDGGKVNDGILTTGSVTNLRFFANYPGKPITIWVAGIEVIRQ